MVKFIIVFCAAERSAAFLLLTKRKPHAKRVDKNKAEAMDRKKTPMIK